LLLPVLLGSVKRQRSGQDRRRARIDQQVSRSIESWKAIERREAGLSLIGVRCSKLREGGKFVRAQILTSSTHRRALSA
jgi:hypothetical protein